MDVFSYVDLEARVCVIIRFAPSGRSSMMR